MDHFFRSLITHRMSNSQALAEAVQENDTIHSIILFGNPCAGSQAREHRPVSAGVARRCCRGSEAFRRIHARCSSNYQAAVQALGRADRSDSPTRGTNWIGVVDVESTIRSIFLEKTSV